MSKFKCPEGLGVAGERAWRAAYGEVEARGSLRAADEFALERYARAVDIEAKLWAQVDKDGAGLTVFGSQGQPVTDPLVDSALKAAKHAEAFAKALGIEVAPRLEKNRGGRPSTKTPMADAGDVPAGRKPSAEPPLASPLRVAS